MKKNISRVWAVIALKIKWSGIAVTDGRGKLGGTVFTKNRSGAAARNKVTPVNRRTSGQSYVRALLTAFSQNWRNLTASQRAEWNTAVQNGYTTTNIFGDVVRKSGINLYCALNIVLQIIEETAITNVPSPDAVPAPLYRTDVLSDVSASTIFLRCDFGGVTPTVIPADTAVLMYATPKLSTGVSFVKSQLRVIGYLSAGDDTASVNVFTVYQNAFGTPAVGDNIVFAIQAVNNVSGVAGTPIQAPITIQA